MVFRGKLHMDDKMLDLVCGGHLKGLIQGKRERNVEEEEEDDN